MTQLTRIPYSELTPELAALHDQLTKEGVDARLVEAGANAPELLDWYFNSFYAKVFYDARTKELLRLKLSKTHGCYL
jgi:hypothetical protein